jgi:uncharacterized protein (TIGR03086 family)
MVDVPERATIADDIELLALARLGFRHRLELVLADDWARPTPCSEWNLRQLVNHVVGSDLRYAALLNGGNRQDFTRRWEEETGSGPVVGDHPVEDWTNGAAVLDAAMRAPGAMDRVVDYPRGPLRGRDLLENRIVDITIHTWDLARAIEADDTLHERLVRRSLSARVFQARPDRPAAANDGSGSAPDNARLQRRLLRASGRSPS